VSSLISSCEPPETPVVRRLSLPRINSCIAELEAVANDAARQGECDLAARARAFASDLHALRCSAVAPNSVAPPHPPTPPNTGV
jgi:hypothetical protein